MIRKIVGYLFCCAALFTSCQKEAADIENHSTLKLKSSKETGIDFSNNLKNGSDLNIIKYLYYYNGGGVAIGDINNDGLEDVFFTANEGPDKLYLNKGNLSFEDITKSAGIFEDESWSSGVVIDDINGDGLNDIYVSKVGVLTDRNFHNLLYINNGDGTFVEQAAAFGLNFRGFATQACFVDYDQDGDLDVYLLNHAVHSVRSYGDIEKRALKDSLSGDRFYENRLKEENKFVEVTEQAGILSSPLGYGLAITAADVNNDGWTDIYVGNDFHENDYLYINNGDKTFTESIKSYFQYTSQFSMGVDIADMNNDGNADVFTTDMMPYDPEVVLMSGGEDTDQIKRIKDDLGFEIQNARNHFQINDGRGHFREVAFMTNTFASDWSWSVLLQDFDNDMANDIYITNGIVGRPNDLDYINYINANTDVEDYSKLSEQMPSQPLRNILFSNQGDQQYSTVENSFVGPPSFSNGAAYADLDKDGDLDIVVNNINQPAFVLENTASASTNYLSIQLEGSTSAPMAKGAKVTLSGKGGMAQVKEYQTTKGFQSSSTHYLHFGLANLSEVESVSIRWPDGMTQQVEGLAINQHHIIKRNDAALAKATSASANSSSFKTFILPFEHQENKYFDENSEKLIPERDAYAGPALICEDLNGDGITDIYIGGARNHLAKLLYGTKSGSFTDKRILDFETDSKYEDIAAAAIDFDGDGDKDIYVVSGGNDNKELDKILEDRIYLNNNGDFKRIPISLPHTNGSCIAVADYDKDGFDDIFVGASTIPGSYGLSPYSFLLKNLNGRGVDIAHQERYGMVKDSKWVDIDGDDDLDLAICGDWMNIRIYENDNGTFIEKTKEYGLDNSNGFWNAIEFVDINKDGRIDILAGNAGVNNKWKASDAQPIKLYVGDFDQNGSSDPIIFFSYFDRYVPFASLDKLTSQLPFLKKKFTTYESYKMVQDIDDLIGASDSLIIEVKEVSELRSMVYLNEGGQFKGYPLAEREQATAINDFEVDANGNVYYIGNNNEYVAELGPALATPGRVLSNFDTDKKIFSASEDLPLPNNWIGRSIRPLTARRMLAVSNQGAPYIIFAQ